MMLTELLERLVNDQHWRKRVRTLLVPSVPFEVVKSGLNGRPALMLASTKRGLPSQIWE